MLVLIRDGVYSGWCLFGMVSIRDGFPAGWCAFGMMSIWDGVHSGWCPSGMVSIRDCAFRDRVHLGNCPDAGSLMIVRFLSIFLISENIRHTTIEITDPLLQI